MNKSQHIERKIALRFRRWSRKAYAAFISVNHVVTIGHLATYVSERFQIKNLSLHGWLAYTTGIFSADLIMEEEVLEDENFLSVEMKGELCGFVNSLSPVTTCNGYTQVKNYIVI